MNKQKKVFCVQVNHPDAEGQFQVDEGIEWIYYTIHPTQKIAQAQIDECINEQWFRDCDDGDFRIVKIQKELALRRLI